MWWRIVLMKQGRSCEPTPPSETATRPTLTITPGFLRYPRRSPSFDSIPQIDPIRLGQFCILLPFSFSFTHLSRLAHLGHLFPSLFLLLLLILLPYLPCSISTITSTVSLFLTTLPHRQPTSLPNTTNSLQIIFRIRNSQQQKSTPSSPPLPLSTPVAVFVRQRRAKRSIRVTGCDY